MSCNTISLFTAGFVSGVGIAILTPRILKKTDSSKGLKARQKLNVLFFPDQSLACLQRFSRFGYCAKADCGFSHQRGSFAQVIEFLSSPTLSLDIAIYMLCSPTLGQLIEELYTMRKVAVRIIVDQDSAYSSESHIPKLQSMGVPIRINEGSNDLIHHKFAVVDGKSVMTGSFNWTQKAVTGNNENIVIIEKYSGIGKKFLDEFEKLWEQLK